MLVRIRHDWLLGVCHWLDQLGRYEPSLNQRTNPGHAPQHTSATLAPFCAGTESVI